LEVGDLTLSPDQLRALSLLLDQALDLAAEERAGWLENLPADQAPLRPLLAEMLANHGEADMPLPPLPEYSERELDALAPGEAPDLIENAVIGPYRLLRELGRGGMGSVWLAERVDGALKRQVALKLPHSSLPQRQLAERFARERDILAALTHPHIARLYDAGVTGEGRPYLALEYVEGEPITAYADAHRLAIVERLALFLQVLSALQYAHGQQVVHRDIKPSNILVTADGEVKLLDFGIAKLLTDGEARETELTQVGGRALTPQYASPEQILGQPLGVASDVYSLGVVLYELLTGSLPYRLKRDSRGALEDAILAADPTRPSQTEVLLGNAEVRASTVRRLSFALKGDLDTIILKALKKQAAERYATAQDFADDLRRHVAGEPVAARPDSPGYRARKFLRRNWLAVGAATAVFMALAVGLGVALWQAQVARTEAQTAKAVQSFLLDIFQANSSNQADPQKARNTTARELLDIGARKIDAAVEESPQAKMQILSTLGDLYVELGLNAQSAELQRKRIRLAKERFGRDSREEAEALLDLAYAVNTQLGSKEWQQSLNEAEGILDRRGESRSPLRARLYSRLADYYQENDLPRAADYIERSIGIYRDFEPNRDFVSALYSAATIFIARGEWARARAITEEAIAIAQGSARESSQDFLPNLYTYLGQLDHVLNDLPGADAALKKGWELSRAMNGPDHLDTITNLADYAHLLASTGYSAKDGIAKLEESVEALGRAKGGEELANQWLVLRRYGPDLAIYGRPEQGLQILEKLRAALASAGNSTRLAGVTNSEAAVLVELGREAEANRLLDEAQTIRAALGGTGKDQERYANAIRVRLMLAQNRVAEAGVLAANSFSEGEVPPPLSNDWLTQRLLDGQIALQSGRASEAFEQARKTLEQIEASPMRPYLVIAELRLRLIAGKALLEMRRPAAAEPYLREAITLGARVFDVERSPEYADSQIAMARCHLDLGQGDAARALVYRARAIFAKHRELGNQYRRPIRALNLQLSGGG
jgi:serine/threonine protein kinase